jgi:hypothetical protein
VYTDIDSVAIFKEACKNEDINALKELVKYLIELLKPFPDLKEYMQDFARRYKNLDKVNKDKLIYASIALLTFVWDEAVPYSVFKIDNIYLDCQKQYLSGIIIEENVLLDGFIKDHVVFLFSKRNKNMHDYITAYKTFMVLFHLTGKYHYSIIEEDKDVLIKDWERYKLSHDTTEYLFDEE